MKTLIYGLGNNFERNKGYIEDHYDNLIFCDGNINRVRSFYEKTGKDIVTWDELDSKDDRIGNILITPVDGIPDIANRLHVKGFSYNRIQVLAYEMEKEISKEEEFYYGIRFYGQGGDDAILMFLFKLLEIAPKDLSYLEIGTNDPMLYNNTYNFYRAGARGVIVDPMPVSKYLASLIRPDDKFLQVAVSGDNYDPNNKVTFYVCSSSQGSSIDKALVRDVAEEIEVSLVDVNYLLSGFGKTPELLVIDAEGQDEMILRSLDYNRYKPMVIEAEVNKADEKSLESFIIDKGYFIYARTIANTIFVREDKKTLIDKWFK